MDFDFRHLALLSAWDRRCVEAALTDGKEDVAAACLRFDVTSRALECGEDIWSDAFTETVAVGGERLLALMLDLDMGD